jgi:hypothetical protein
MQMILILDTLLLNCTFKKKKFEKNLFDQNNFLFSIVFTLKKNVLDRILTRFFA